MTAPAVQLDLRGPRAASTCTASTCTASTCTASIHPAGSPASSQHLTAPIH